MQRFGRDLWGRRPVADVMNAEPLVLSLDSNLEQAAKQVTAGLQYPITEDFILVDGDGLYRGLGTVLDLLKAMELRIAQRNRVLRQALVDLKESQAQLVQSEKMASLGQMVAGVAHELNTPLGYVRNNVQLLDQLSAPLVELAREIAPDCLRILLTGYSDLDAAVEALNSGGIFRYLTKPWDPQEMAFTLRQAAEIAARPQAASASAPSADPRGLSVLLLDEDPETLASVADFCMAGGHRLLRARSLTEAIGLLNEEGADLLVSDLRCGGEDTAPLLKSLAQAHPRLLSLVVTPFRDTQALLQLVNEAQIFRYLPKPIRRGLFEKGLKAAAEQARNWREQPAQVPARQAELPREAREKERVGSLLGMLGRLRERLSA
uniref:response regulator n=1 Tax=Metapseudomonas otitidis TaxID=319939 RepID=UPI001F1EFEB7|nr:response regulator [Pseudomonas otitidis]